MHNAKAFYKQNVSFKPGGSNWTQCWDVEITSVFLDLLRVNHSVCFVNSTRLPPSRVTCERQNRSDLSRTKRFASSMERRPWPKLVHLRDHFNKLWLSWPSRFQLVLQCLLIFQIAFLSGKTGGMVHVVGEEVSQPLSRKYCILFLWRSHTALSSVELYNGTAKVMPLWFKSHWNSLPSCCQHTFEPRNSAHSNDNSEPTDLWGAVSMLIMLNLMSITTWCFIATTLNFSDR